MNDKKFDVFRTRVRLPPTPPATSISRDKLLLMVGLSFFIRKKNMNKQKLSEIVRGELNEMIGFDVEPVAVPKNAASDLGDAHALIIKAMELMEKAKTEAVSDELQTEIQKVQDSLIRGATDAMTALVDLVSMESSLADE